MPYIGNDIQFGELTSQSFTGDGSTTAFTLGYTVANPTSLIVTIANVIQEPTTAYTVAGTTLTCTSAPADGDTIHVRFLGRVVDVANAAILQDSDQDTKIQVEESADEDTIRFDTGGTERVTINSTSVTSTIPLYIPDGSASTPSVTNTGDTNTGIFFPAADTVGVAVGGTEVWRYGSNPTTAKNLLINGAMTVDQREGETRTNIATAAYHIDQWKYAPSGSPTGRFTLSRGTGLASLGFARSLRVEVTTADAALAADALYEFSTHVEAQNLQHLKWGTANAQDLNLSFSVITDTADVFTVLLIASDGSRSYSTSYTVASADVAQSFSLQIPGDTGGTINNDTGRGFELIITLAGGANFVGGTQDAWGAEANNKYAAGMSSNMFDTNGNYFEISGVQLEVGSVATDFEHEDIGTTLRKCLRYLWQITEDVPFATTSKFVGKGTSIGTTTGLIDFFYPVPMRALPTRTSSAATDLSLTQDKQDSLQPVTSDGGNYGWSDEYMMTGAFTASGGGITAEVPTQLFIENGTGGYMRFSAEL